MLDFLINLLKKGKRKNEKRKKGKIFNRAIAFVLATALVTGVMPGMPKVLKTMDEFENVVATAKAESKKTISGLGTTSIVDPEKSGAWNYVYFGNYDGTNPTRFRVLELKNKKFVKNMLAKERK